ncbi:MAG: response regulator transcription factor [Burkholderiales bacterium]|nr:response regulator [Burkholderiales bacterium]MDE1929471.1 response regulator transcription factor [Burkholderiales bacterium]MDE2159482.1 response regulator transcription factor [Burkholderiales bacterium]MDE2505500.1 response regulator transcription factor [Burkholderiales bacterium]
MTMAPEPAVHLVDDEAPVRDALAFLFHAHGLARRTYASGPELLAALDAAPLRGCIVLDVRMEPMSGLQLHDALVARGVALPVLFLSGHGDIPMAVDALKKGAFDFIEKPFGDAALVERVQRALRLEASEQVARSDGERAAARLASLTEREHEVMLRVAAGRLNKVIADELGIAVRTVEVHRARVYAKLGVRSAAEVATRLAQGGGDQGRGR